MNAFRWLVLMVSLGWMGLACGQEVPGWLKDENVPPAPLEQVTDDSGFLSQNPGSLELMRAAVRKLAEERGFKIYVVIQSVLIDSNAQELAGLYQEAWLPQGNGLVFVYESDSRSLGIGRGYDKDLAENPPRGFIPSHQMVGIIERSLKGIDSQVKPESYIEALTLKLADECQDYFRRAEAPLPKGRIARLVALSLGVAAVVALIALGLGLLVKRSGGGGTLAYHFPETNLPQRLGAPYGGGKVIVQRFGRKA